ncbi:beta-lactamase-like protein [Geopyxis carbonaria]|nr:beta-lactamase-like protein [Geopyxis carbonaria]
MFHFTPLLGAHSTSPATQSLLELDNSIKILIDVGWDSTFAPSLLTALETHTPTIDLILLTHPTVAHMGAYAHACKHIRGFGSIPVYSTFPVTNLGRLMLQDMYLSCPAAYTLLTPPETTRLASGALKLPPTPSEIEAYCSRIVTLKYSQPTALHSAVARVAGKLGSVTITAYEAGHTLGGTIWKIQQAQESIVYAVDWNLSRDNCLRGAAFLGGEGGRVQEQLARPTALVCSAKNASITNITGGRKKRDEMLLETIKRVAVDNNGTVLIPTDSVGRVLELAYLLEHAWRADDKLGGKNKGVGLYMAGRKVKRLSQVVGSMLEWMDEAVVREFEAIAEADARQKTSNRRGGGGGGDVDMEDGKTADVGGKLGPFDFLHLNLVATPGQLTRILNNNDGRGKVIIASDSSLEWGLGRDAIMNLAGDEKTMVVMTERGEGKVGLAGRIWQGWQDKMKTEEPGFMAGLDGEYEVEIHTKRHLEDAELQSYLTYMSQQDAIASKHESIMTSSGLGGIDVEGEDDSDSESSDDDSDSERQGKALTTAASKKASQATLMMGGGAPDEKVDLGVNILLRGEGIYDYDVRGAKGRNRMFPFQSSRKRVDEYGEVVRPDDYMRAEERQEEEAAQTTEAALDQTDRGMGKKRKWTTDPKPDAPKDAPGSSRKDRRRHARRAPSDNDDYDPDSGGEDSGEEGEISSSSDEDSYETTLSTPAKLITTRHRVSLRCSTTFIDFSGLHDQKSLRMLLPLIDPKKLILVAGKREETQYLAEFYREKAALSSRSRSGGGSNTDVFSPQTGTKVNASVDTNAWLVKLGAALDRSIKWQNVRGLGVVHVLGRVTTPSAESSSASPAPEAKKQKTTITTLSKSTGGEGGLVLDTLPPALAAATRSVAQPIHVGDIRLADLRRVLQADGHTAEFRGEGTLLVDGVVVVRKTGVGSVSIEDGGMGFGEKRRSFMAVRRKVYDGLAVVAGG